MTEKVILVDTKDTVIGEMEKLEAHQKAHLHRAVSVFIFNSKGQLLIQKRALNKYHSPGLWTNTACTHPFPEESAKNAARRRLKEEMGLIVDDIIKIFDFIYKEKLDNDLTEHEFDHVFIGISDDLPVLKPSEVYDYKYIGLEVIMEQIKNRPNDFIVWFKKIIEKIQMEFHDKIIQAIEQFKNKTYDP